MRLILAGTRSFGAAALDAVLAAGHDVAYVVAPPEDRLAVEARHRHDLDVAPELDHKRVASERVDLIVGAHTHTFVGWKSRANTALGALIGHPSLLPRHRGRDSVEWTVRMNDPIAGFTYFWADRGVDTGPIAKQDWCFVDRRWTASDLWRERLFPLGIDLLLETLKDLDNGVYTRILQDRRFATTEPSLDRRLLERTELLEIADRPYDGPTYRAR